MHLHHSQLDVSDPTPPTTGHGKPFQEKAETAEYRVVYSPNVVVRDKPWGRVIGRCEAGEVVKTTHRAIGVADGPWVKTEKVFGTQTYGKHSSCGWMLVDGASINLPLLLERVGSHSSARLRRYRVAIDKLDVRERPMLAGTAVVCHSLPPHPVILD